MEEKSFLKILKEYFSLKADNEILVGDKKNIVIPMEWIFTEKIDREIIERAMAQLLKQHRPDYVENYVRSNTKGNKRGIVANQEQQEREEQLRSKANSKIKNISLNVCHDGIKVIVNGIDNWTKAIISENPQEGTKILQVSEDELYENILRVLKSESIIGILDALEMTDGQKEYFQTLFASEENKPIDEFTLSGIKDSMAKAAQNLTEYYEYLSKEKEEAREHFIVIYPRQGRTQRNRNVKVTPEQATRRSPVYPFVEREKILREMEPSQIISVHGCDELGEVIPNIYTTFVFDNPRGQRGKLIVSEPLEGTHSTRMLFMTEEQFEQFEIGEGENKYEEISRKYLEMSAEEFDRELNSKRVNHADIDKYREKLQYIIDGTPPTKHKEYYNTILNELYGKKKITPEDIGNIAEKALGDEVKVADSVLDEIGAKDRKIDVKGETND